MRPTQEKYDMSSELLRTEKKITAFSWRDWGKVRKILEQVTCRPRFEQGYSLIQVRSVEWICSALCVVVWGVLNKVQTLFVLFVQCLKAVGACARTTWVPDPFRPSLHDNEVSDSGEPSKLLSSNYFKHSMTFIWLDVGLMMAWRLAT